MANLIERHAQKIVGVLSCFDRLVLQGTLPSVAYPQAMATELDREVRTRTSALTMLPAGSGKDDAGTHTSTCTGVAVRLRTRRTGPAARPTRNFALPRPDEVISTS